jgi:hypothetical protein
MKGKLSFVVRGTPTRNLKLVLEQTAGDGTIELDAPSYQSSFKALQRVELAWNGTEIKIPRTLHFAETAQTGPVTLKLSVLDNNDDILASDTVQILVIPPIAVAPGGGKKAAIWIGPFVSINHAEIAHSLRKAGWEVDLFSETITESDSVNRVLPCTLESFINIQNYGFILVCCHGNPGRIYPFGKNRNLSDLQQDEQIKAEVLQWVGNESGLRVVKEEFPGKNGSNSTPYKGWVVEVDGHWIQQKWKSSLDRNNAIVMIGACHSKKQTTNGTPTPTDAAGGRIRFGFGNTTNSGDINTFLQHFLHSMNLTFQDDEFWAHYSGSKAEKWEKANNAGEEWPRTADAAIVYANSIYKVIQPTLAKLFPVIEGENGQLFVPLRSPDRLAFRFKMVQIVLATGSDAFFLTRSWIRAFHLIRLFPPRARR